MLKSSIRLACSNNAELCYCFAEWNWFGKQ